MKRKIATIAAMTLCGTLLAEPGPGGSRAAFLTQQAYDEMMRVGGQVDVLQANLDEQSGRIGRLESAKKEIEALKAEIAGLKAANAQLQSRMESLRGEIVADLTKKLSALQKQMTPPPAPRQTPQQLAASQPHKEYTVQSGDTLSVIATAFNTTISRIKEMNGLKSDNIRVGQKLIVPL